MSIKSILSVCLLVCSFHSRIFHSHGDVTSAGEGLQMLIHAGHSWPLSSKGSLACHTYCDTGHSFIMVISEDPWHLLLLPSVWEWSRHHLFLRHNQFAPPVCSRCECMCWCRVSKLICMIGCSFSKYTKKYSMASITI